jgi:quinol monooxygenase YgiN
MRAVMVRYKVKPGHAEENEALVRAVYRELDERQPGGLRYATFKLDDGLTFVHLAWTTEGPGPLPALPAFQRFQAAIRERCDEPPVVSRLEQVGSFRWLGDEAAAARPTA